MRNSNRISDKNTVLVIIDIQERLYPKISEKENMVSNISKLIRFAKIIEIPILLTEQYPKGLGRIIPEISRLVDRVQVIEKVEFSCLGSEIFKSSLIRLQAKTLIIAGIEAHICVCQTALEAMESGYKVCVVRDAISSRCLEDKDIAVQRIIHAGGIVSSTEMLIYEILKRAGTSKFRESLGLVK